MTEMVQGQNNVVTIVIVTIVIKDFGGEMITIVYNKYYLLYTIVDLNPPFY